MTEKKGTDKIWWYSLQQHTQKHDENTPDHAQHQNRGDRLFVVCCDHGKQVCVLTPHPDKAWVAPAAGMEGSKKMHVGAIAGLEAAQRIDLQKLLCGKLTYPC